MPTINNLIAWYESVGEKSFIESEASDGSLLSVWVDSKMQGKINGIQNNDVNKPRYALDETTGLPIVKFIDQDFFSLPDGTVPFNNMPYTVFFVSQPYAFCYCGLLGSGSFGTNNATNVFRYDPANGINHYWWYNDLYMPNTLSLRRTTVLSFLYDLTKREGYIDGVLRASVASSNRASTPINNTIGNSGGEFLNGFIGEIIIFDRALNTEERKTIESYLGRKWSIKVS